MSWLKSLKSAYFFSVIRIDTQKLSVNMVVFRTWSKTNIIMFRSGNQLYFSLVCASIAFFCVRVISNNFANSLPPAKRLLYGYCWWCVLSFSIFQGGAEQFYFAVLCQCVTKGRFKQIELFFPISRLRQGILVFKLYRLKLRRTLW